MKEANKIAKERSCENRKENTSPQKGIVCHKINEAVSPNIGIKKIRMQNLKKTCK